MTETLIAAVVALFVLVATQAWMDRRERLRRRAESAEVDRREFTTIAEEAMVALHEFQQQALEVVRISDKILSRGITSISTATKALQVDLVGAEAEARVAQTKVDGIRERMRLYRRDDDIVTNELQRAAAGCLDLVEAAVQRATVPDEVYDADGVRVDEFRWQLERQLDPFVDHVQQARTDVIDPDRVNFAATVRRERFLIRVHGPGSLRRRALRLVPARVRARLARRRERKLDG